MNKNMLAALISSATQAADIEVVLQYHYTLPATAERSPVRVRFALVREHREGNPWWHVVQKVDGEPADLLFSRTHCEREEALFHMEANIKKAIEL